MNTDLEPSAKPRINCLGELGRGETTIVELIYDEDRQATFARKRWPRTSAELRFRLKQQFRRAQAIEHRNLVRLYDLDVEDNETSLIMEAVTGSEVVAHMQALAQGRCDDAQYIAFAVDVLRQLTEALVALHAGGLVHRDVKPRNVLIEPNGRVVLLDPGFAWPPQHHFDAQRDRVLAATLPYLAPECLRGALPSEEADWYSFGALASELLTGRAPFSGSLDAVLRAKDAPFQTLREACSAVPELLDELVCALLFRDPIARPTAIEVQEVLAELAQVYPVPEGLAADGGGDEALDGSLSVAEPAAIEASALPSITAPAVSMVVGPSAESLALKLEVARSQDNPEIAGEAEQTDAATHSPVGEPPTTARFEIASTPDAATHSPVGEPPATARHETSDVESFESTPNRATSAPRLQPSAAGLDPLAATFAALEPVLSDLALAWTAGEAPMVHAPAVSQAQTLEYAALGRRSPPIEHVSTGAPSRSQAQTLEDGARDADAELYALETLSAFESASNRLEPSESAADALGLDLATELRDALVSRRVLSAPATVAAEPRPSPTHRAWTEPSASELGSPPATTTFERMFEGAISAADADVLDTLDRVLDEGDASSHQDTLLGSSPERERTNPDAPPATAAQAAPDADGGERPAAVADPWLERALDPAFAPRAPAAATRETWIDRAFEQSRASSADVLPKVSPQPVPAVHEDPTGRFAVPDTWLELALDAAQPLARVDIASMDEPWAALTLEPLDSLPPLATEDAEHERDPWRALEPHELPDPLRDPDFPALPLYDDDDDPALELAEARPTVIGLLAATQLTAANDVPATPAPPAPPATNTPRRTPTADLRVARLEQQLCELQPQLVLIRGDAGSGKTELFEELLERVRASPSERAIITCRVAPAANEAFLPVHALVEQLLPIAERRTFTLAVDRAAALQTILPELRPHLPQPSDTSELAIEPQRRWIDAVLGLRAFIRQLTEEHPLLIAIDDADLLDLDSAHLLRALLAVAPVPNATWLLTQRADAELPAPLAAALKPNHGEARLPTLLHDMDPLRSSRLSLPPVTADEIAEHEDAATLISAAHAADEALALQRSAELHTRALRAVGAATPEQLEAAATALARAGRLLEASETWLSAARQTPDPLQAQRFELNAGAALLRTGDENRGRELLQSVLKICELGWPRAPLLTSTLERARLLLQSHRPRIPVHDAELRRRRFDALWHSAKELVLIAPVTGDALSVRALREALLLGDASRLAWALGYEAVSAANIGGSFMRRRASTLVGEMRALSQQSRTHFDLAYARSVEAAVAFLSGDWYDAEQLLRTALHGFARAPEATAHEEHVVGTFLVSALEAQGKLEALSELLPDLQLMAAETGHRTAYALYALAEAGLPALARDRAPEAIASADAVLAEHGGEGFSPLHFQHFVVTASARLYAGHYAQAFQQVEQTWQRVRHTYLPQLDAVSVMLHQLRARAALALAKQSSVREADRLIKHAAKVAHELSDSSLPHALALRHVLDANVSLLRGRPAQADAHCWQASQCFEGAGMTLMSEVARHARAALAETAEAQADAARCRAYFARIGIVRPSALTGAWFPAFGN